MFAFWPSFGLLIFFLVIFLECRAIAGRVTLPLGSFLMVFCFGAIGAPLLALLLQQIPIFAHASAWLIGPPIEELAKALPVIVLAFLTRESRRLSIADLTLIGFASGAGFGFVEANLNAIANGALPSIEYLAAFGLQTDNGIVFFAGHAVTTALVGLAAGIGLRFLPPKNFYAWVPSAFAILWASFDHGIYNWKLLNAADGALPNAHFAVEFLHGLTLKGQLAIWFLPIGLIVAQFIEAYLCSIAVGVRRDLLLAREWRPWVANEWLVALMRTPLGRAVFSQTLAYFRLRRAFYLAAFETRRDPTDPTLSRHARSLEDRLKRERSILFDPAPGTWLLPAVVLKGYALQWAWRMRWVLVFAVLVLLLFMLDPRSLPEGMRQVLFGDVFSIVVVTAGLAFAVWRIILFGRVPPPDPLTAEGTAFASHYTRQLLLGCSLACGLFPSLAMLLGWKALLPGAAFIGGYLPGWIGQGGNLQILLGLGAIGGSVAPDPRPAGEAFRHEIAAGEERIRRLGSDIDGAAPAQLDRFFDAMGKLDAERDAQARRQLALDGCERQASEATIRDPAPVVQAIKDEFDHLAGELLEAAAKELDAMASLERAYSTAWSEIMQDLDDHDGLHRRLRTPLREAWQKQNDIGWALRVVESTDDVLLPMQLTLLPELREVVATAINPRTEIVAAGVERIRTTAAEYGESDPFGFAGPVPVEDDNALLAEFAPPAPAAEEPKTFGLRIPHPAGESAPALDKETDVAKVEQQPASRPAPPRGRHYQQALDQLIEATRRDNRYLETIRHLERSDEVLRQPVESQTVPRDTGASYPEDSPAVASSAEHQDELEDLINAIKRDSGYVDFAKDAQVARAPEKRRQAKSSDDTNKAREDEAPKQETADERKAALAEAERQEQEKELFAYRPAPVMAAKVDTHAKPQPEVAAVSEVINNEWAIAAAAYKQAQEQPPAPSVEGGGPPTAAAPEAQIEPPQAEAPSAQAEPVDLSETEAPAAAVATAQPEIARPAEPEAPADAALREAVSSHAEIVEHTEIETPSGVVETAQAELAIPAEPEAPTDAEPVERAEIEVPAAAVETPTEPEAPSAPIQAEAGKSLAGPVELEAPDEPAQHEVAASRVEPVERTEAAAPVEPHQPTPETKKPEPDEPRARTETRVSFFARLFEAALRQSSGPKSTSVRRDTSQANEEKPNDGLSSPAPREHAPAIPAEAEKHDAKPQQASNEISGPTAEWLADFTALSTDGANAQSDDTPLEKIEWPVLSRTAQEDRPADKLESLPSIPDDVAKAFEAPVDDDRAVQAPSDSGPTADTNEVAHPVAAMPATDSVQQVEFEAPKSDAEVEAPDASEAAQAAPAEPSVELASAPAPEPVRSDDAASPASDDTNAKVSKPDGADEFGSKVDRLSHLLDKLERAMQAATPALKEATPPAKPADDADQDIAPAQASEPTIAVDPAPAASQPPVEEAAQPKQPDEHLPAPVEALVPAEATTVANAQPDVPQALADEPEPVAAITPSEPEAPAEPQPKPDVPQALGEPEPVAAITPSEPEAPAEPQPKPDIPQALADERTPPAEPVAAITPSEPEASAEPQPKPDRLSFLLTKLFEAVNKNSTPKAVTPEPIEAKPAPTEAAPPTDIAPDHPAVSEILDLRGPHPIAEPLDESTSVEPTPQEQHTVQIEQQPAPVAPPAQTQSAVVEELAAPVDAAITEPARDGATPIEPSQPALAESDVAPAAPEQANEQPIKPRINVRLSAPASHFGSRKASRSSTPALTVDVEPKPPAPPAAKRSKEPAHDVKPVSTPRRDWKLESEATRSRDSDTARKSEPTIRMKTGSGALATVDTTPAVSPAVSTNTPSKYYGPRHVAGTDGEAGSHGHAQQHAISLADALTDYYNKSGAPQPAIYTTDRATLHRIIAAGKLDAPRRRGAPWSISGMSRRGDVAIRLKPGSEQYVEFVPSTEIFGQVPHYYPRGVGKGTYDAHVPAEHLEYFDVTARQWAPLRG